MPDRSPEKSAVVRHEEELLGLAERWRGVGYVRARKRIDSEWVREEFPLESDEVVLERVAAEEQDSGQVETLADGSISIPVYEEELVVEKRLVLKERVIVRKRTVTEKSRVRKKLRKERVEIDADPGIEVEDAR